MSCGEGPMIFLRWVLFSILVLFGAWAIIINWIIAFRKSGSLIPVVGGFIATIALLVAPWDAIRTFWWVPLVVDLGCMPILFMVTGFLIWRTISRQEK
jgi:hypothetical protein